jgi:mRNA interferase RelE/StbE
MSDELYEPVVARPAARAISDVLPESVATAVTGLITGALIENPHRVGRELRREVAGIFSARRGTYRVLYRIDGTTPTVTVLRIDHRSDVYRTRSTTTTISHARTTTTSSFTAHHTDTLRRRRHRSRTRR